jgi:hypothetical protein
MACRRGLSSLGAVISSFSQLSLSCSTSAAPSGLQQLATLTCLRHVVSGQAIGSGLQPAASLREYSAAAAAGSQPGPGPTESLEEVRSRIFGTYIGEFNRATIGECDDLAATIWPGGPLRRPLVSTAQAMACGQGARCSGKS